MAFFSPKTDIQRLIIPSPALLSRKQWPWVKRRPPPFPISPRVKQKITGQQISRAIWIKLTPLPAFSSLSAQNLWTSELDSRTHQEAREGYAELPGWSGCALMDGPQRSKVTVRSHGYIPAQGLRNHMWWSYKAGRQIFGEMKKKCFWHFLEQLHEVKSPRQEIDGY